jgi:transposase
MAMGRRGPKQQMLFVRSDEFAGAPRHRFYEKLNELLDEAGFDAFVEEQCAQYFAQDGEAGRVSTRPGVYFRMLLLGYFEGIESERGICWRVEDSLSLRSFLGIAPHETTPDHSTMSRLRTRFGSETYVEVFHFVMRVLNTKGLLRGKVAGVDATYLRADASMKSIVRRGSGEGYKSYLKRLARAAGIENPTDEDARRMDRTRKKKTSNAEWRSPTDPDAEITKLKDGRTRLAYKAEHVVDMETGAVLAADVLPATAPDGETIKTSLEQANENIAAAKRDNNDDDGDSGSGATASSSTIEEVVADKGYHKISTLRALSDDGVRTYIPERKPRGEHRWKRHGGRATARVIYDNGRRVKRAKGKQLQRDRGERIERTFAHVCETGGARRTRLRGIENVKKRYLMQVAALNLGLLMTQLVGCGTPRGFSDAVEAARAALLALAAHLVELVCVVRAAVEPRLGRASDLRWGASHLASAA